jgi:hypothetical protein
MYSSRCGLKNNSAYYATSTKTTNTQKQNTRTDKTKTYDRKKQYEGSTRTKTLKK